jgi:hypothetical protein
MNPKSGIDIVEIAPFLIKYGMNQIKNNKKRNNPEGAATELDPTNFTTSGILLIGNRKTRITQIQSHNLL